MPLPNKHPGNMSVNSSTSSILSASTGAVLSMSAAPAVTTPSPCRKHLTPTASHNSKNSSPAHRNLKTKSPIRIRQLQEPLPVATNNYSLRFPPRAWCESNEGKKIELISKLCNNKIIQEMDALAREKAFSFGLLPVVLYNEKEKRSEFIDYIVKEVMKDVEHYNTLADENHHYHVDSAVVTEFLVRLVEAADRVKNIREQPQSTCGCVIM